MPAWSSYEPHASGRGYTLYDDNGQSLTMATSPALEGLVAGLPSRQGATGATALADASGVGSGAPTVVDQRPQAAPSRADVPAGGYSSAPPPEPAGMSAAPPPPAPIRSDPADGGFSQPPAPADNVSRPPPPQPVAMPVSAQTATGEPAPQRDWAPPPGGQPAAAPGAAPRPVDPRDNEDQVIGAAYSRWLAAGSRGVFKPAEWRDTTRSVQTRNVDPNAIKAYDDALAHQEKIEGEADQERGRLAEEARQLEVSKRQKGIDAGAAQDAAARKYQEDRAGVDADIEKQRQALADPNAYWKEHGEGKRVQALVFQAIEGIAQAIGGRPINLGSVLQEALRRDTEAKQNNVRQLHEKRGKLGESFKEDTDARQAAYGRDIAAVDALIKDTVARASNPRLREVIMSDEPADPVTAAGGLVLQQLRAMGHNVAPSLIDPRATLSPEEAAKVPPLVKVARERVRDLGIELAQAQRRVAAARDRLGLARELASTTQLNSQWLPNRTEGGRAPDMKGSWAVRQDMARLRRDGQKLDIERNEAEGKTAAAADAAREKLDGRTVYLPGAGGAMVPYITDARSEAELQKLRDSVSMTNGLRPQLDELEAMVGPTARPTTRAEMRQRATQMLEGMSTASKQGVLNIGGYKTADEFADDFVGRGAGTIRAIRAGLDHMDAATKQQHGLRPAPAGVGHRQ